MQLENNFIVPTGIDEAWKVFNDPETIYSSFPGATLESADGDSFTGTVKVKLGPISLIYKGKGTYVERDEANHRVVIDAQGRDSRGNGTASAVVTGIFTPQGDSQTAVKMITDMTVTGRPAQFGRGMISDISDKIIGQFSAALADRLGGSAAAEVPVPAGPSEADPTSAPRVSLPSAPSRSSDVEAIDLLDTAGAPVLKRLIPVLTGLVAVLVVLVLRRRRRRRIGHVVDRSVVDSAPDTL